MSESFANLEAGTDEFNEMLMKSYRRLLQTQNSPYEGKLHTYKCRLCRDVGFNWEIELVERVPQMVARPCRACAGRFVKR